MWGLHAPGGAPFHQFQDAPLQTDRIRQTDRQTDRHCRRNVSDDWLSDWFIDFICQAQAHCHDNENRVAGTTRNSSEKEIANVNFLTDDIIHALQNTLDSYTNSATDRRRYVLERRFTKFSEITRCNGHYDVQGHSRWPILLPIESSYKSSY